MFPLSSLFRKEVDLISSEESKRDTSTRERQMETFADGGSQENDSTGHLPADETGGGQKKIVGPLVHDCCWILHGLLGARVQGKQECSAPLYRQASLRQRAPSRYRGYFSKSCCLRRKEPAATLSAVISRFYSAVLFWMGRTGYLPATSDPDN